MIDPLLMWLRMLELILIKPNRLSLGRTLLLRIGYQILYHQVGKQAWNE